MSDANEYEERNRARKVFELVRLCEKMGWSADDMEAVDEWRSVAHLAGVKPPSDRTKAIVLHVLRERSNG